MIYLKFDVRIYLQIYRHSNIDILLMQKNAIICFVVGLNLIFIYMGNASKIKIRLFFIFLIYNKNFVFRLIKHQKTILKKNLGYTILLSKG